jgi:hypothetical protein
MKNLSTLLRETEQALREYDPVAYEDARRLIESVVEMTGTSPGPLPRVVLPREEQI